MERQGVPLKEALTEFLEFVGQDVLVGYHLAFDLAFLREACLALKIRPPYKPLYRPAERGSKESVRRARF